MRLVRLEDWSEAILSRSRERLASERTYSHLLSELEEVTKGDEDRVVGDGVQRVLLLWTLVSEVIISLLFLGSLDTSREDRV